MDVATKALVKTYVPDGASITVIPRVFEITPEWNAGAAFGMLQGAGYLLAIIGLVVVFAIVKLRTQRTRSRILAIALGLLLGGAVGNLIDRLTARSVYDFLDFHHVVNWPIFNMADVAVTIGGALLVLYWVSASRSESGAKS